MKLKDKVAIVTGATSGMGRATAYLFAKEGAKVVVTGRNEERAKAVVDKIKADGGEATYVIVDASKPEEMQKVYDATIAAYGTVDVLFNNAGMLSLTGVTELTQEELNNIMNVNVGSALYLTQLCVPVMKAKGKGVVINTCSVASYAAHYGFAPYITSKHAIAGLTKSMAWELGPEIRVNGIAPGLIHTAMVDGLGGVGALQGMIDNCPLKRPGEPEEIATVALFLACDDSAFMDGQLIKVDGGYEC